MNGIVFKLSFLFVDAFISFSSEGANPCLANVNLMKVTSFFSAFKDLFELLKFSSLFHFPLFPSNHSDKTQPKKPNIFSDTFYTVKYLTYAVSF